MTDQPSLSFFARLWLAPGCFWRVLLRPSFPPPPPPPPLVLRPTVARPGVLLADLARSLVRPGRAARAPGGRGGPPARWRPCRRADTRFPSRPAARRRHSSGARARLGPPAPGHAAARGPPHRLPPGGCGRLPG